MLIYLIDFPIIPNPIFDGFLPSGKLKTAFEHGPLGQLIYRLLGLLRMVIFYSFFLKVYQRAGLLHGFPSSYLMIFCRKAARVAFKVGDSEGFSGSGHGFLCTLPIILFRKI